jgi:hypothetical protein
MTAYQYGRVNLEETLAFVAARDVERREKKVRKALDRLALATEAVRYRMHQLAAQTGDEYEAEALVSETLTITFDRLRDLDEYWTEVRNTALRREIEKHRMEKEDRP